MPLVLVVPLAGVIMALCLLLLIHGPLAGLGAIFAGIAGEIPIIGSNLADRIRNTVTRITDWVDSWAPTALGGMVAMIAAPVQWVAMIITGALNLVEGLVASIVGLGQQVAALAASVAANVVGLLARVVELGAHLASLAASVPGIAADIARSLVAAAESTLRALVATVRADLQAGINAVHAALAAGLASLAAALTAQVAAAVHALSVALAGLTAQVAHDVQAIDGELTALEAGVGQLAGVLPLVAAVPVILELVNVAEDCLLPQCRLVGPTLPILSLLGDLATLGLVGALVGEAVRDPEGAARVTADAIKDVEGAAHDLFGLFTGAGI